MNKSLLYLSMMLIALMMTTACNKDKNNDNNEIIDDGYGSMTITTGNNIQTVEFVLARQSHVTSPAGNMFMVYFSGSFIVVFNASDKSATTLPDATYPVSTTTPIPVGNVNLTMNIAGVSGVVKATDGSFKVQKNGSDYIITFNFTTDTDPEKKVAGRYKGPIPLN